MNAKFAGAVGWLRIHLGAVRDNVIRIATNEKDDVKVEKPATCPPDGHVVLTPRLLLRTPTKRDLGIAKAAASDREAQRWLNWDRRDVMPSLLRWLVMSQTPRQGRPVRYPPGKHGLIAVDPWSADLAGSVAADLETGEIGGSLSPWFRGQGLGAELFGGAAELLHHHFGIEVVRAGADPANAASVGALLAAGFTPTYGPSTHIQPDGRVIPARWFRHVSARPTSCDRSRPWTPRVDRGTAPR